MNLGSKIGLASVITSVILAIFISGFVLLTTRHVRSAAHTDRCASNLHQIALAILLYKEANHGQFPRTLSDDSDDPKPIWGTPYQSDPKLGPVVGANPFTLQRTIPLTNDVTASLFLLARTTELQSYVFVCPDSDQEAWDFGGAKYTAANWTNWAGDAGLRRHLSYSFQNPFVSKGAITAGFVPSSMDDASFAIASDMNPGGSAVTSVNMRSTMAELQTANSRNHDGKGQCVLYGDGHAEWETNPFCGMLHDNIFTAGGPETAESPLKNPLVNASTTGPQDSVLLPTSQDLSER